MITLGCGDDTRATAGGSATATTTNTTVDLTTGTSDGTGSASEASVTQGSMSEGMTTSTASDPTTTTNPSTTGTTTTTSDTTGSTGAVSAGTSTGFPGPVCGNGVVEEGEQCDDGDDLDKNACSNACVKVPCDQQEGGGDDLENVLSYIWISNSSQNTVSKIDLMNAANSGEYSGIRRVG